MKSRVLSLANAALYLVTCGLIGTGLLLELRMDDEDGAARLFGMGQDDWGEIHFAAAIIFAATTVLHIILNWAWIKAALAKARWASLALTAGFALIAALLLWPTNQTSAPDGTKAHHDHENDD
jgi:hypothetical protein